MNTKEYKDASGEWRLTHESKGQITLSTTEGYKNRKDMQQSLINACIGVLKYYGKEISVEDNSEIHQILLDNGYCSEH